MENTTESVKTASQNFFENQLVKARAAEAEAQRKFNFLAIARLAVFAGMLVLGWLWNKNGGLLWISGLFALLIAFLVLMRCQQAARRNRDFHRNLQTVNEDELERLQFRFKRTDTGTPFQEKDHAYSTDLDIFGEYSLYKLLNRTRTEEGARRLASWLKNPASPDEIRLRQQASEEFKKNPDVIQLWEATALLHEHAAKQIGSFRLWASDTLPAELASTLRLRWWPLVTVFIAVFVFAGLIPYWPLLLSLGVHLVILRRFQMVIQQITDKTTALGQTLTAYSDLLAIAESTSYNSHWWLTRKALIQGSSAALKSVGSLFEKLDYKNNPFFFLFAGVPTLWDLHCLAGLENWKRSNHTKLNDWLDVLADIEAMNSLGGHAFANPDYILPEVVQENEVFINALSMGHPLIPANRRISNDFSMRGTGHTILVTGSNMSGKSTFLRTIGLNLVLAQTGAAVSASGFSCSPVRVFSSMRTQDSLEESTSSFYAELKRLKKLLDLANENNETPVFYLLDEILKGTNSVDRHKGAEALIRQLHEKKSAGLVSTHDLELGEWGAHENYVHNFHFRSDVENGKLKFDYQLHEGICRSFNASELMRMMGIEIDLNK
ncbi:MutS-related protein [Dyadobacter sediminis]|uniref:DNA mismatch repair protein MutS n=1 Tax=Dyadobacter sediminis TaxID=1493691 RepID=A0A5R9K6V6_9BACT|nr:DNA mismatch repair protein MutS [Dyadobacter sediminis]TLU89520.1 DNA mismatch repair protein MutS [Dyadobacter sediminis]GGC04675.1 DNA mismatch repair protein [Dyadobacter sediminis]